jgi:hypothetical protein
MGCGCLSMCMVGRIDFPGERGYAWLLAESTVCRVSQLREGAGFPVE